MKLIKKIAPAVITVLLLVVSLLAGCPEPVTRTNNVGGTESYQLVLLHTNDHHGTLVQNADNKYGGVTQRATFIKQIRAQYKNVLLLDAGDINTGTPLSNMNQAEPDIKAYNLMGYDAVTFGNHEFDQPFDVLKEQMGLAEFPFISANITDEDGNYLGGHQYLVKEYDGFKVGIFGLTTLRTEKIARPDSSLTFIDEITAANDAVALLRAEGVSVIIALTHMGIIKETPDFTTSRDLANAVDGINIIVDGHSHSKFSAPEVINGTSIVSANYWGRYIGRGIISIAKLTGAVQFNWQDVQIGEGTFSDDADMITMLQPYIDDANAFLETVIGATTAAFDWSGSVLIPGGPTSGNTNDSAVSTRCTETAIGDMIADAYVWYATEKLEEEIDFAFCNGGGIRANIEVGDITWNQILTTLPFNNSLFILSLKGDKVKELFEFVPSTLGIGGFPQFSAEVIYTFDRTQAEASGKFANGKAVDITIGGEAIDDTKTYRIITNDFVAGGGDGYVVIRDNATDLLDTSILLSTVVAEYIQSFTSDYIPDTDDRLTFETE